MLRAWLPLLLCLGCDARASDAMTLNSAPRAPNAPAPSASAAPQAGPIRMEVLDAAAKPPLFVMRGGPRGGGRLVFLHGMCGHGLGYAQSFQYSAARLGTLIAPQADVSCGGVWSKWSGDVDKLD